MQFKKILIVTITLFFFQQIQSQESHFDGFHLGIDIDKSSTRFRGQEYSDDSSPNDFTQSNKHEDSNLGLEIGYNYVFSNNILLGVDASWHDIDDNQFSYQKQSGVVDTDYSFSSKIKDRKDLKVKLGYVFNNDKSLLYLTSGFSVMEAESTFENTEDDTTDNYTETHSKYHTGIILGLGGEHFINDQVSIKAEYLKTNYGRKNYSTGVVFGGDYFERMDLTDDTLRVGVNYYFKRSNKFSINSSRQVSFNGFYLGVDVNNSSTRFKGHELLNGSFDDWTESNKHKDNNLGLEIGYNYVFANNILLGVDASWHDLDDVENSFLKENGVADVQYRVTSRLKDRKDLKAKLGYVFNESRSLVYLTSGISSMEAELTHEDIDLGPSDGVWKETHSKYHTGIILGLGGEHFINDQVSIKAEYLKTNYGRKNYSTAVLYGDNYLERMDLTDETLRLGLNYYF